MFQLYYNWNTSRKKTSTTETNIKQLKVRRRHHSWNEFVDSRDKVDHLVLSTDDRVVVNGVHNSPLAVQRLGEEGFDSERFPVGGQLDHAACWRLQVQHPCQVKALSHTTNVAPAVEFTEIKAPPGGSPGL